MSALIYILFLTFLLLFPFDFQYPVSAVKTDVGWSSDRGGVEIPSSGMISSLATPQRLYDMLVKDRGITIEVWLSTNNVWQHGPARIVSYSYNKYLRNFTLGQERKDIVFRLRTTETNLNGIPPLVVSNIFIADSLQHLVVTYDLFEEAVYLNGAERLRIENVKGGFSDWDSSYNLVLGNESTGNRQWRGKLFLMAIYNRALSAIEVLHNYQAGISFSSPIIARERRVKDGLSVFYLFNEGSGNIVKDHSRLMPSLDLKIPETIEVSNKVFLRPPYQNFVFDFRHLKDMIINIGFFVPFGFFLYIHLRRWYQSSIIAICSAVAIGLLFSVSIESLQYLLVSRSSSLTDVVHNTIGVAVGVIGGRGLKY